MEGILICRKQGSRGAPHIVNGFLHKHCGRSGGPIGEPGQWVRSPDKLGLARNGGAFVPFKDEIVGNTVIGGSNSTGGF